MIATPREYTTRSPCASWSTRARRLRLDARASGAGVRCAGRRPRSPCAGAGRARSRSSAAPMHRAAADRIRPRRRPEVSSTTTESSAVRTATLPAPAAITGALPGPVRMTCFACRPGATAWHPWASAMTPTTCCRPGSSRRPAGCRESTVARRSRRSRAASTSCSPNVTRVGEDVRGCPPRRSASSTCASAKASRRRRRCAIPPPSGAVERPHAEAPRRQGAGSALVASEMTAAPRARRERRGRRLFRRGDGCARRHAASAPRAREPRGRAGRPARGAVVEVVGKRAGQRCQAGSVDVHDEHVRGVRPADARPVERDLVPVGRPDRVA